MILAYDALHIGRRPLENLSLSINHPPPPSGSLLAHTLAKEGFPSKRRAFCSEIKSSNPQDLCGARGPAAPGPHTEPQRWQSNHRNRARGAGREAVFFAFIIIHRPSSTSTKFPRKKMCRATANIKGSPKIQPDRRGNSLPHGKSGGGVPAR